MYADIGEGTLTSTIESETGESQYSVMYVGCKNQYPHTKHFVWLSTPVPVTDLMTDRHGNALQVVPDKPRSASWRSMSGSVQMLLGDCDVWRAQRPIAGQAVQ